MRQIVLDTETTGLEPKEGHRIIEIGCVELVNRKLTGNDFHLYLNPDRNIDAKAIEVHGISNEFLQDKPHFYDIDEKFMAYLQGAQLIIHNAPFDVGFINHELALLKKHYTTLTDYCTIEDTLVMARLKHPGQRNNLDALCKRYNIDNTSRTLHGALLDAQILAKVYLAMTGGQVKLALDFDTKEHETMSNGTSTSQSAIKTKVIYANKEELKAHQQYVALLKKQTGEQCIWE